MTNPTTIDTDTNLSAVNSILGAIGQSPITTALNFENPETRFIFNILTEVNKDVQNEGWVFNTATQIKFTPDSSTKRITITDDIIRFDLSDGQVFRSQDVIRKVDSGTAYLFDKIKEANDGTGKGFEFDDDVYMDVTYLYEYTSLPQVFRRYIVSRASVRAATQLVNNPQLVQLLQQQEAYNRAGCLEYECNQGDHSFLGFGHNQSYRAYQPYKALRR
jgi:hypothetical protein